MLSWAMNKSRNTGFADEAKSRSKSAAKARRSEAKHLSDEQLLVKLRSFGIELERSSFGRLCEQNPGAEALFTALLAAYPSATKPASRAADWIRICLAELWQRWFPEQPSFESLDDKIQTGYDMLERRDGTGACRLWLQAWTEVLGLLDKTGIASIEEFDRQFRGTEYLFNWLQDLGQELWNAGLDDREFFKARIALCERGLSRLGVHDQFMTKIWRCALAESYFELGETAKTDALFHEWLQADAQWGGGWVGWSQCYQMARADVKDLPRAEQLLREGLAVAEVRDFGYLAERLASLYEAQGREQEAKQIRSRAETTLAGASPQVGAQSAAPFVQVGRGEKIGRNDPCPCGSGKKFKKCCSR